VLDVHAPHESVHGWRDFLLHLVTITIGLFIALSLEGCIEWQHHRHLVHEAEASLHDEIKTNSESLKNTIADIHKQQEDLKHDVVVLKKFIKNPKSNDNDQMEINFGIRGFKDVGWRTAQSTGAFAYMPYATAQEFADIYRIQDEINIAQHQAARDAIISLAPFTNMSKDDSPTSEQATVMKDHIEVLQGQLSLLGSWVNSLDEKYKTFLTAHP